MPVVYPYGLTVNAQWRSADTTVALAQWRDAVARTQVAYDRFTVTANSAASALYEYQRAWSTNVTYATTSAANATLAWNVEDATPQNQARWRREKLELLRASKRARKTLMKFLDAEQLASYAATGRFKVVASNGWVFELRKQGNPLLLGDDGHADASFCIHPRERFPDEDKILSFMLLLMSDVDDFLRIANRTTIRQRPLAPVPPVIPSVTMNEALQEERWRREHVRESQAMLRAEGLSDAEVEALRRPPNQRDGLLVVGQQAAVAA